MAAASATMAPASTALTSLIGWSIIHFLSFVRW
jgi:hypothetical protein